MRYYGEDALGLVETVGMVPALEAADKMLKAAAVELTAYENVGSTLVTIMIKGDVAAVRSSVEAGAEAALKIGKLTAKNVMPRPVRPIGDVVTIYDVDVDYAGEEEKRYEALGLIETFGIIYVLQAADAMCKAAGVKLIGFENVASGYISILVSGDVGACETAVKAGVEAVQNMESEVYSSVVISRPHRALDKIIRRYRIDGLIPDANRQSD